MESRRENILYLDEIQRESEVSSRGQAQALHDALLQRLSEGEGPFTVDFSGIQSVGPEAYAALAAAAKSAKPLGRTLELSHPPLQLLQRIGQAGQLGLFGLTADSLADLEQEAGFPDGIRRGLPIIVPASLSAIQVVRDVVVQVAREMGFTESALADIELCVGEAGVNAVRYGSPKGVHDRLTVRIFGDEGRLVIEIKDTGAGFDPEGVPHPSAELLRENGLGVFLMRNLMDRVTVTRDGGTTVRLEKVLPGIKETQTEQDASPLPLNGERG
jgi:serine/threonine-protein kinase RsbW